MASPSRRVSVSMPSAICPCSKAARRKAAYSPPPVLGAAEHVIGRLQLNFSREQLFVGRLGGAQLQGDAFPAAQAGPDVIEGALQVRRDRGSEPQEVLIHTQEHLRLSLQLAHLVVDLLERAGGGEEVFLVVERIEHGERAGSERQGSGRQQGENEGRQYTARRPSPGRPVGLGRQAERGESLDELIRVRLRRGVWGLTIGRGLSAREPARVAPLLPLLCWGWRRRGRARERGSTSAAQASPLARRRRRQNRREPLGHDPVDELLVLGRGGTAERQRHRAQPQLEQAVTARRLGVVVALRRRRRQISTCRD